MRFSTRKLVAYLLLLLLPLQAIANAGVFTCADAMPNCHEQMMATDSASPDCCDQVKLNSDSNDTDPQHSFQNFDSSPCSDSNSCVSIGTIVGLTSAFQLPTFVEKRFWQSADPISFISFIPDSLRRPPSILV